MAQAIEIRLWCDVCLAADEHTEGETITVGPMFGGPAFELEACDEHVMALGAAVGELRRFGRKPESTAHVGKRTRTDDAPAANACPICGEVKTSLASLRSHLRDEHDRSLADVGLARRVFKCSECPPDAGFFERGQGFSAHRRSLHPNADPDGRAVAQKAAAA